MPTIWTTAKSIVFWTKRPWRFVAKDIDKNARVQRYKQDARAREQREIEKRQQFLAHYGQTAALPNSMKKIYSKEAKALEFWMTDSSWSYCKTCKQLLPEKLMPKFINRPLLKVKKICTCASKRYIVPRYKDIPKELRSLTKQEITNNKAA